ncbi:MAG: DNA-binding protein WhiA [Ruminococcaceae bacterium]|nr:DNA-binding protein WhiA [Oscillospiraceae bacterium]
MSSFALQTKESLCELNVKGLCCKKAQLFGMLLYGAKQGIDEMVLYNESDAVISLVERFILECYGGECEIEYHAGGYRLYLRDRNTISEMMRDISKRDMCPKCLIHNLRGVFLACGTVNDPEKSYRLELKSRRNFDNIKEILDNININYKTTVRDKYNIVYIKESESIEDLLTYIGATGSAFSVMNAKIEKEIRNSINRASNCDTANIAKSVAASAKQVDAIKKLIAENRLGMLPENIRITAQLRLENPDASLIDLARMHQPEITKSGLNHRLKKIIEFAEAKEE